LRIQYLTLPLIISGCSLLSYPSVNWAFTMGFNTPPVFYLIENLTAKLNSICGGSNIHSYILSIVTTSPSSRQVWAIPPFNRLPNYLLLNQLSQVLGFTIIFSFLLLTFIRYLHPLLKKSILENLFQLLLVQFLRFERYRLTAFVHIL